MTDRQNNVDFNIDEKAHFFSENNFDRKIERKNQYRMEKTPYIAIFAVPFKGK